MRIFAIALFAVLVATPVVARTKSAPPPALRTDAPAQAIPAATKPSTDAPREATPAMWVVHGPKDKGTAYLLGSIHALPKNVNWQTPEITAAIKRADTFVFEVKMDDDSRAHISEMFAKQGLLPISESLPSYFDQEMRNDYNQVVLLTHADPTYLVYMRPWLAAMVLQGVADGGTGFIASEGVDNKIYAEAVARHVKRFLPLEAAEDQMKLFVGNGDMKDEIASLKLTFEKIMQNHKDMMTGLLDAWAKGDTKALAAYGPDNPAMSPAERKALLEDRNRKWIPEIVAMLNQKHVYFITVGAGHLVGQTGVPNLLREKGYKVDGPDAPQTASLKLTR
jgi:uncharacterized protein